MILTLLCNYILRIANFIVKDFSFSTICGDHKSLLIAEVSQPHYRLKTLKLPF